MILLERGGNALVQQLAEDLAHEQSSRSAASSVGARFREQLRDLIARLNKCALCPLPHLLAPYAVPSAGLHAVTAPRLLSAGLHGDLNADSD